MPIERFLQGAKISATFGRPVCKVSEKNDQKRPMTIIVRPVLHAQLACSGQCFVAMYKRNNRAKFYVDIPSGYRLKFISVSAIERFETPNCFA